MGLQTRTKWAGFGWQFGLRTAGCLAATTILGGGSARGQAVLVPAVEYPERTATVEQASENWLGSYSTPLPGPPSVARTYPLEVGPVRFHPHLSYQLVYGDGLLAGPDNAQKTTLHTISPGAYAEIGRNWGLDFTAGINRYDNASINSSTNTSFKNTTDFFSGLSGKVPIENGLLNFSYRGSITEQPRVETGTQVSQNSQQVAGSWLHYLNGPYSFEVGLRQDVQLSDGAGTASSWSWSSRDWFNIHLNSKTTAGLGIGGGYNFVDPGPESIFGEFQGRLLWFPTAKLSFQIAGGLQAQHFDITDPVTGSDAPETGYFPIAGASIVYQIFEPTTLALTASRTIENSILEGQLSESSQVGGGIRQRLLRYYVLTGRANYTFNQYLGMTPGLPVTREDRYLSLYAGVSTVLFKKINLAVFYQFTDNSSSSQTLAFDSTQVGFRVEYRY